MWAEDSKETGADSGGRGRLLVVTPTLGVSSYLDAAIASVTALDLPILHVLAAPQSELAQLRKRFPDTLVTADAGRAGGIYGALNAGLQAAPSGWDWFTYINDDDELAPGFARVFREHTAQRDPEPVTYGEVRLINEEGGTIGFLTTERAPRMLPRVLQAGISPLNQQGMLFHRTAVQRAVGFDLRYRICADLDFWARTYATGSAFRYYPVEVGRFRIRRGQISGDVSLTRREQDEVVARSFPGALSRLGRLGVRCRYRLYNLPRYLARLRSTGWKTSNQILSGGGAVSA
jgi:glycosyltransferase involved in cell wall biosynthesis